MEKQDINILQQLIRGLNQLPVAGKGHMSLLVNCISVLEGLANKYAEQSEPAGAEAQAAEETKEG